MDFKRLTPLFETAPSKEYNFIEIISPNHINVIHIAMVFQYINIVDFNNLLSGNFLKGKT